MLAKEQTLSISFNDSVKAIKVNGYSLPQVFVYEGNDQV